MLLNEGVHSLCRTVAIYDSRCLKKTKSKAVSQLHGHTLSISSAYFSPCTGNRVLTTSLDNHLRWCWLSILKVYVTVAVCSPSSMSLPVSIHRIYDTSEMTSESPLLTSIRYIFLFSGLPSLFCAPRLVGTWPRSRPLLIFRHDMQTGRWLTKLSAVWDPKQEDCFVVGSMARPRRVQVFHESGDLQHTFMDPENLTTVLSVTAFHPTRNALVAGNASGRLHVFSDWDEVLPIHTVLVTLLTKRIPKKI